MLGEKMGTMTAKVINKVNPANNGLPSFESSTEGSGTLVGVEVQQMSTYKAEMLPSGSMYGECPNSGVVMAKDGIATFRATGAGSFTEDGGSKFRGSLQEVKDINELATNVLTWLDNGAQGKYLWKYIILLVIDNLWRVKVTYLKVKN